MRHDRDDKNSRTPSGEADDAISRSIKRAYDKVTEEPIPDTLQSLLERLKQEGSRE